MGYRRHMTRPPAPPIPTEADERETLIAFLDYYRAALLDRAYGLSDEQLQIALPPTTLTLSRLIGHMTFVERWWFQDRFDGEDIAPLPEGYDFEADPDAEMAYAQTLSGTDLLAAFNESAADSRRRVDAATLDQRSARSHPRRTEEYWNLRWIMVHMIEEYARHCGHADLIRESIDGNVAE